MTGLLAAWGELPAGERVARLRALAGLVHVFVGQHGATFELLLRQCEADPALLEAADRWFGQVAAIPRRRILSVLPHVC